MYTFIDIASQERKGLHKIHSGKKKKKKNQTTSLYEKRFDNSIRLKAMKHNNIYPHNPF